MASWINYIEGQKIGELTYIMSTTSNYPRKCLFKCECGKEFEADLNKVRFKSIKNCGCIKPIRKNAVLIERYNTPDYTRRVKSTIKKRARNSLKNVPSEYRTWTSMINRCSATKGYFYKHYKSRGIKVCDRWLNSFDDFYSDMGIKPTPKHSIDRIDVNGNYEPSNCRWATSREQSNNKTNNSYITYLGETKTILNWSRIVNMSAHLLCNRRKLNWPIKDILTLRPKYRRLIDIQKEEKIKVKHVFGVINI